MPSVFAGLSDGREQKSALCSVLVALLFSATAIAAETDSSQVDSAAPSISSDVGKMPRWYFQTSILSVHTRTEEERNNNQWLLNLERHSPGSWIVGGALFQNSFDQPSQYVYVGKLWRPLEALPAMHVKLTGGLLHGYKGEHEDSIPFNDYGVAPVIVPTIGFSGRRFATELVIYYINGVMWTVGVYFK